MEVIKVAHVILTSIHVVGNLTGMKNYLRYSHIFGISDFDGRKPMKFREECFGMGRIKFDKSGIYLPYISKKVCAIFIGHHSDFFSHLKPAKWKMCNKYNFTC